MADKISDAIEEGSPGVFFRVTIRTEDYEEIDLTPDEISAQVRDAFQDADDLYPDSALSPINVVARRIADQFVITVALSSEDRTWAELRQIRDTAERMGRVLGIDIQEVTYGVID